MGGSKRILQGGRPRPRLVWIIGREGAGIVKAALLFPSCLLQFQTLEVAIEAIVTTKSRFTIPLELRRKYEIKPGTRIVLELTGGAIRLRPELKTAGE